MDYPFDVSYDVSYAEISDLDDIGLKGLVSPMGHQLEARLDQFD